MATYKPIRKTASGTEEIKIPYAVLADPPTIPAAITSINGLSGGTLTSPLTLTGGDSATASKIILSSNGQITDSGTSTMLGFSGGNYIVGSRNYPTTFRGKQTRPTWNGKDLALHSDIPAAVTESTVSGWGFTKNTGTVTSVAVKMNGATKGTVTSSGTIDLGTVITSHQDISGKANLSGGNTFTGKQTLNSPASDGYSINAAGYIKGSWLQSGVVNNKGSNTGKVCVFDGNGWIYYRTPSEILSEASGVPKSAFSLSGTTLTITI